MNCELKKLFGLKASKKTTILLWLSVVFFFAVPNARIRPKEILAGLPGEHKRAPAAYEPHRHGDGGRLEPGEVRIYAEMESPAANIVPQNLSGTIVINLIKDNEGRSEVGSVNFLIRVPYGSMVDIETRIGNLTVSNITGGLVRAHISSEGDITLSNISSGAVSAENVMGDIFFDGEIQRGGNYRFASTKGAINLRIPFESSFKLVATAPSTRSISLGAFAGGNMTFVGDGRRVVGKTGDGSATLSVTNQRGTISFIRRN